jgi:proteasome lid subunit RPN8/RPN11
VRLMFVGDVSLGEHYFSFGHGPRSSIERGDYIFSSVHDVLNRADYVVANLEGPISDIDAVRTSFESMVFRGADSSAAQLKKANINIVNLANNHIIQHGQKSLDDTIKLVSEQGIQCIGLDDPEILIVGDGDSSCALTGMSAITDNTHAQQSSYLTFSLDSVRKKLAVARSKADKVVLILHWGDESLCQPSEEQRALASQILTLDVDLIVGHHPHIFYEIERHDNRVVAYSLGNFVFDLPWDVRLTRSGILDIEFDRLGGIEHCLVWPVHISANGKPEIAGIPRTCGKNESLCLYDWRGQLQGQSVKKLAYFLWHFFKGNTKLKAKFLLWKLWKKISRLCILLTGREVG